MLLDLEKNGMDAVRRYSRKFDDWDPPSFELERARDRRGHRAAATSRSSRTPTSARATCARSPRRSCATLLPLRWRSGPGVILGHKHIPVQLRGQLHPRRALPDVRLGADEHHPGQGGGREDRRRLHAAGQGPGLLPGHDQRHEEGRRRPHLRPRRRAGLRADGLRHGRRRAGGHPLRRGQQVRRRGQAAALRPLRHRPAGRARRRSSSSPTTRPIRRWWPATCSARPSTTPTAASA